MRTEKVIVEDYNKSWMDDFAKIKAELESILGQTTISIEHVGSTSVVGLSAKPTVPKIQKNCTVILLLETFYEIIRRQLQNTAG